MSVVNIPADLPFLEQYQDLLARMARLGRVMVAYSGGIDSSLLMEAGTRALGEHCVGVIARSETLTSEEYDAACALAAERGWRIQTMTYSELEIENYASNPPDRCYFCKFALFSQLKDLAVRLDLHTLAEGSNADDESDWRPGMRAVAELEVVSPLREAGLHKDAIRQIAHALGLPNWDKPANPCLSSRIAYGVTIDREKLEQVAQGERFLRSQGFTVARVRHHGSRASLEVGQDQLARMNDQALSERVVDYFHALGFEQVEIDPKGYRQGSLNAAIGKAPKQA